MYMSALSFGTWGRFSFDLTVRDTGIGIPPDELEHIFERFYQAQNELTGSGIGTGIGLSLVYELVKMLEGEIQVKSTLGKGTTFSISFPLRKESLNPGAPVMKEDIRSNINILMPSLPDHNIMKADEVMDDKPDLLIIEDNPDVLKYLQVCLEDYYRITTCMDGQRE